jgi:hypothetical protein
MIIAAWVRGTNVWRTGVDSSRRLLVAFRHFTVLMLPGPPESALLVTSNAEVRPFGQQGAGAYGGWWWFYDPHSEEACRA